MNAGGVPNTCKSNGELAIVLSGEWVSNALVTYPEERNNSGKLELIPHVVTRVRGLTTEGAIHFGRDLRPIS